MYFKNCIGILALVTCLSYFLNLGHSLWCCTMLLIAVVNRKWLRICARTFRRDCTFVFRFAKLHLLLTFHVLQKNTVHKIFLENVRRFPQKICLKFEDENWTFQDIENYSNRVAHFFKSQGCKPGDVIALLMDPSPKYVCTWLGLAKIGCTSSLINLNLRQEVLKQSLTASKCTAVLLSTSFVPIVEEIYDKLQFSAKYYINQKSKTECKFPLEEMNLQQWPCTPVKIMTSISIHQPMVHIYTSGTTVCAKATDDVLYSPLPLYHSMGGMISIGQALILGSTVAIRAKFSASECWNDCIKYGATSFHYIGEMCRYLLDQPSKPCDRSHRITRMSGTGLRKEYWGAFQKRFGVKIINEYYALTEGNCGLLNICGTSGSVGFVPYICPSLYPISLIKINEDTLQPIRDQNGLCVKCEAGEPGEIIGAISDHALRRFVGYVDKSETAKKILHAINKPNDKFFRSGDLLVRDEEWNFYFYDRVGDTYRWQGENVSTTEVEGVLSSLLDGNECVVYGVRIPGYEGRAGMATIVDPSHTVDVRTLYSKMVKSLPSFARPVFLRLLNKVEVTATFKYKKCNLKKLGFSLTPDNTVYFKKRNGKYELMNEQAIQDINDSKIIF